MAANVRDEAPPPLPERAASEEIVRGGGGGGEEGAPEGGQQERLSVLECAPHDFVRTHLRKPTKCALCRATVWGVTKRQQRAHKCNKCRKKVHARCAELLSAASPPPVQGRLSPRPPPLSPVLEQGTPKVKVAALDVCEPGLGKSTSATGGGERVTMSELEGSGGISRARSQPEVSRKRATVQADGVPATTGLGRTDSARGRFSAVDPEELISSLAAARAGAVGDVQRTVPGHFRTMGSQEVARKKRQEHRPRGMRSAVTDLPVVSGAGSEALSPRNALQDEGYDFVDASSDGTRVAQELTRCRSFHGNLSKDEAEELLQPAIASRKLGIFLFRLSTRHPGMIAVSYTALAGERSVIVRHSLIDASASGFKLQESGFEHVSHSSLTALAAKLSSKFKTALEVDPLSPRMGDPPQQGLQQAADTDKAWFFPDMIREEAERKLGARSKDGGSWFLIRGSSKEGAFALSKFKPYKQERDGKVGQVKHFVIENKGTSATGDKWEIIDPEGEKGAQYSSLSALVSNSAELKGYSPLNSKSTHSQPPLVRDDHLAPGTWKVTRRRLRGGQHMSVEDLAKHFTRGHTCDIHCSFGCIKDCLACEMVDSPEARLLNALRKIHGRSPSQVADDQSVAKQIEQLAWLHEDIWPPEKSSERFDLLNKGGIFPLAVEVFASERPTISGFETRARLIRLMRYVLAVDSPVEHEKRSKTLLDANVASAATQYLVTALESSAKPNMNWDEDDLSDAAELLHRLSEPHDYDPGAEKAWERAAIVAQQGAVPPLVSALSNKSRELQMVALETLQILAFDSSGADRIVDERALVTEGSLVELFGTSGLESDMKVAVTELLLTVLRLSTEGTDEAIRNKRLLVNLTSSFRSAVALDQYLALLLVSQFAAAGTHHSRQIAEGTSHHPDVTTSPVTRPRSNSVIKFGEDIGLFQALCDLLKQTDEEFARMSESYRQVIPRMSESYRWLSRNRERLEHSFGDPISENRRDRRCVTIPLANLMQMHLFADPRTQAFKLLESGFVKEVYSQMSTGDDESFRAIPSAYFYALQHIATHTGNGADALVEQGMIEHVVPALEHCLESIPDSDLPSQSVPAFAEQRTALVTLLSHLLVDDNAALRPKAWGAFLENYPANSDSWSPSAIRVCGAVIKDFYDVGPLFRQFQSGKEMERAVDALIHQDTALFEVFCAVAAEGAEVAATSLFSLALMASNRAQIEMFDNSKFMKLVRTWVEADSILAKECAAAEEPARRKFSESVELELDQRWRIDPVDLRFGVELGSGSFGVVYKGEFQGNDCVIKRVRGNSSVEREEVISEAVSLSRLRPHASICAFYGVVLDPSQPPCVVLEFIQGGDLNSLLKDRRRVLTGVDIVTMAKDLASGVHALHENRQLHLDLAPRNLLVVGTNPLRLRITDFGLSKCLPEGCDEVTARGQMLPWRWVDPDVFRNRVFTKASDTWAFAVCVWEMLSREVPYSELSTAKEVGDFVTSEEGGILQKPALTAQKNVNASQRTVDDLYKILLTCWHKAAPMALPKIIQRLAGLQAEGPAVLNMANWDKFSTSSATAAAAPAKKSSLSSDRPEGAQDEYLAYERMLEAHNHEEYGKFEEGDGTNYIGDYQQGEEIAVGETNYIGDYQQGEEISVGAVPVSETIGPVLAASGVNGVSVSSLTVAQLDKHLEGLNVTEASRRALREADIDGSCLGDLDKDLLDEIGVKSVGDRIKLLKLSREKAVSPEAGNRSV